MKKNKLYFEEKTKEQENGVSGPACYIEFDENGYIFYKNNKEILYAFELKNGNGETLSKRINRLNKHCVIAASLTEIFNICKEYVPDKVVTIFAYSQISADEYKKNTREGTADVKADAFEKDLERYSKYIEYFDHVSIFAESVYGNNEGGAEEELIDQIFRLFRTYN